MILTAKGAKAYAEAFATDGMVRVGDLPENPGMNFSYHPARKAIEAAQRRPAALDYVAYYPARIVDAAMSGIAGVTLLGIAHGLGAFHKLTS